MAAEPIEVRVTYKWPDGATVYIAIPAVDAYPQSYDQAAVTALRAFAGALEIIAGHSEDIDEDTV